MSDSSTRPTVCVVVLAYNNVADTTECLDSVNALIYPGLRVLVVDNGSTDGTSLRIGERFQQAEIVKLPLNLGIPAGFNAGIRRALQEGAQYVLLLNNDTTLATDMLDELVEVAETDPSLGVLMPKVLYYDYPTVIWSAGARYRRFPPAIVFVGRGKPDDQNEGVRLVQYAPSCGLLIRRETFERVGLFDPGYLFYFDDWDFSDRVRASGLGIALVPRARMWHKVSRTVRSRPETFWRTWGESCVRFYRRHGRPVAISLPIHFGYLVLRELLKGNGRSLGYFLAGAKAGLARPLEPFPTLNDGECSGAG